MLADGWDDWDCAVGWRRAGYDFGALEVLAPVLDEPARIIVGTSAGGLGAAYLAADAHDRLEAAARAGGEAWLGAEIGDVIARAPRANLPVAAVRARVAGHRWPGPPSLLDTSRAGDHRGVIDFERLPQCRRRHAGGGRRRRDGLRDGEKRGVPRRGRVTG